MISRPKRPGAPPVGILVDELLGLVLVEVQETEGAERTRSETISLFA